MCGICGALQGRGAGDAVRRMLPVLAHRGPDGEGVVDMAGLSLGHRRLAIVDLSPAGQQPMEALDGDLILVANGEIYNHKELRRPLEASGAKFRSDSDSEVILHAYARHGQAAFSLLNGMFAFALFDKRVGKLYLVRDRLGIKPLYYFWDEHQRRLLFASEIKAILAGSKRQVWNIDPRTLAQYLRHQNYAADVSLFSNIRSVRPGSALVVDGSGVHEERYWRPEVRPGVEDANSGEISDRFHELFKAAVGGHLMSDVPVAAYLSSGFDSTLVATTAASALPEPPDTYTGSFPQGGWYDELTGASLVSKRIGARLTPVAIGSESFAEAFDPMVLALDEPRMGLGAISQYLVARAASKTHKVILAGHGGDELFSGYPVFKAAALLSGGSLAERLRLLRSIRSSELPHLVYFALRALGSGGSARHLPVLFGHRALRSALTARGREFLERHDGALVREFRSSRGDAYEEVLLTYLEFYLPGLLVVEDKISMAHSLETRTPFLDNALVDFSLRLSPEAKLKNGELKALIKNEARGKLPDALFELPKRGFPTPLAAWLRGPLKDWARERLANPESPLGALFAPSFLAREVDRYARSPLRLARPLDDIQTHRLWMLLCLESWMRQSESVHGVKLELAS